MDTKQGVPEAALEAQRTLADAMPILVIQPYFDRDVDWNWQQYMHPDDGPRVANEWAEAVAQGRDVIEMEYRLREAATGEYRWFQARAVAVRDSSGQITQWFGTALDAGGHPEPAVRP